MTLETPARIEPCGFENVPMALSDLAIQIRREGDTLGRRLHPDSAAELRSMTRTMNAYYSNLIEGHNTKPREIEAALAGRMDEIENRPLALEAVAHVRTQEWIDAIADAAELPSPVSMDFLLEIHRRFYDLMPTEHRYVEHGAGPVEIVGGTTRQLGQEVSVGRHVPPSADRLTAFMSHFSSRFERLIASPTGQILSIPALTIG